MPEFQKNWQFRGKKQFKNLVNQSVVRLAAYNAAWNAAWNIARIFKIVKTKKALKKFCEVAAKAESKPSMLKSNLGLK